MELGDQVDDGDRTLLVLAPSADLAATLLLRDGAGVPGEADVVLLRPLADPDGSSMIEVTIST